jgi:hypothetical protein
MAGTRDTIALATVHAPERTGGMDAARIRRFRVYWREFALTAVCPT